MRLEKLPVRRFFVLDYSIYQKIGTDGEYICVRTVCWHKVGLGGHTLMHASTKVKPISRRNVLLHAGHRNYRGL